MSKRSATDWAGLDMMTDEDIDFSDMPELNDDFFRRAVVRKPGARCQDADHGTADDVGGDSAD